MSKAMSFVAARNSYWHHLHVASFNSWPCLGGFMLWECTQLFTRFSKPEKPVKDPLCLLISTNVHSKVFCSLYIHSCKLEQKEITRLRLTFFQAYLSFSFPKTVQLQLATTQLSNWSSEEWSSQSDGKEKHELTDLLQPVVLLPFKLISVNAGETQRNSQCTDVI
jgi:hypothetical protein